MKDFKVLGWVPLLWFVAFFLCPLIILIAMSFATRGVYGGVEWSFSTENFSRLLDPIYALIFWRSLVLAFATSLSCFLLALPLAWAVATEPASRRMTWLVVLILPFLISMISRIYAIRSFLGFDGPVAWLGQKIWGEAFQVEVFSANFGVVLYGMVSTYFPFMFFPLYMAFEKFDYSQLEAAMDLGAGAWRSLTRIIWPQIRSAVAVGATLVFVPALGEFVIPDLLGGARVMLAGNLVTEQFLKTRDWPFGAALSLVLIVVMSFMIWGLNKWGRRS